MGPHLAKSMGSLCGAAGAGCEPVAGRSLTPSNDHLLQPLDVSAHIREHNPATGFTALNPRQVDAEITSDFPNRRGGGRRCAAFGFVPVILRLWREFGVSARRRSCRTSSLCRAIDRGWRRGLLPFAGLATAASFSVEIEIRSWPTATSIPSLT